MICEIICVDGFLCMSHLDIVHMLFAYLHVFHILCEHSTHFTRIICTSTCRLHVICMLPTALLMVSIDLDYLSTVTGCMPPATMNAPQQPRIPPPTTMHVPQQPCMPPSCNHARPLLWTESQTPVKI